MHFSKKCSSIQQVRLKWPRHTKKAAVGNVYEEQTAEKSNFTKLRRNAFLSKAFYTEGTTSDFLYVHLLAAVARSPSKKNASKNLTGKREADCLNTTLPKIAYNEFKKNHICHES